MNDSPSKLGLYVQPALLRDNQEVTVVIDESSLLHRLVCHVDMKSYAFPANGGPITTQSAQPLNEIELFAG